MSRQRHRHRPHRLLSRRQPHPPRCASTAATLDSTAAAACLATLVSHCGLGFVVSPLGCGQGLHCFDSSSVGSHSIGLVLKHQTAARHTVNVLLNRPCRLLLRALLAKAAHRRCASLPKQRWSLTKPSFFLRLRRSLPELHLPISGLKGRGRGLGDKGGERGGICSNVQGLGLMQSRFDLSCTSALSISPSACLSMRVDSFQ
jgi:hypothetical protein